MPTILLFDANALAHRGWHAIPPLKDGKGRLVNAVYGFMVTFLSALKQFQPEFVAVAFDVAGKTFRDEMFAEYKAKRVKAPDEFYSQIPLIKSILETMEIPVLGVKGFEADDIIGTLASKLQIPNPKSQIPNIEIIIVTGDQDAIQLVNENTKIFTMRKGLNDTQVLGEAEVRARYGFDPINMIDYKALRGDPSDNIPGIAGIGEKGATKLIERYKTVENIYKHIDEVDEPIKQKLINGRKLADLSKNLATIKKDVPIDFDLDKARLQDFDRKKTEEKLLEFGFKSLVGRLPDSSRKEKVVEQGRLL